MSVQKVHQRADGSHSLVSVCARVVFLTAQALAAVSVAGASEGPGQSRGPGSIRAVASSEPHGVWEKCKEEQAKDEERGESEREGARMLRALMFTDAV
eukprot:3273410-Rhodomonas_salina.1